MKIQMIKSCVAAGKARKIGDVVDVADAEGRMLKSFGMAEDYDGDAPAQADDVAGDDSIVMTEEGLKALDRKQQEALARDMGVAFTKKTKEDELIAAILEAFDATQQAQ